MPAKKINLTMPEDVVDRLYSQVPKRQRSAFVANATEEKLDAIEAAALNQNLIEGYKERAEEDAELNGDWESATFS